MHARTEQLLSLRDGEPIDAQVARHVGECLLCLREIERLKRVQNGLRSLLPRQAPPAWEQVQACIHDRSVERRSSLRQRRFMSVAAAAGFVTLAIVMAIVLGARLNDGGQPRVVDIPVTDESSTPPVAPPPTAALDQLVAQSRQLEDLLRNMPERPRVERVGLAATTDTIEQRIQWLDFQLSSEPDADLSQEQTQRLWRERVDLMDSLVKVRYAQVQGLSF
jgi:hypothetical protein